MCIWIQGFDGSPVGSRKHAALEPRIQDICNVLSFASCLIVSEPFIGHQHFHCWSQATLQHPCWETDAQLHTWFQGRELH